MPDRAGQVCVITGAASGIGAGLAEHAASLGMQVWAADVDRQGLEALQSRCQSLAGTCQLTEVDVRDSKALESLAESVFEQFGRVDLLFNNAGVLVDGKSWERSDADWRWSLEVNIMGVVNGLRSFIPRMLRQDCPGRIINTASIGGLLGGSAFLAPYQATKHAIVALTESLAAELEQESAPLSASVLCPGEVATGIWESDRLREPPEHNVLNSEPEQAFHDTVAGMVAAGLTPAQFAERVFTALEEDNFWILPQTEFKPLLEQRNQQILDA